MANETNITFAKGAFSVTLDTIEVSENYTNKIITTIPNILSEQKQAGTLPDKKIIDLLWVTHEYQIRGEIGPSSSKTAKQIKSDLTSIFNGAGVNGGSVTMTYDGDTIQGYIEKLVTINKGIDYTPTSSSDETTNYPGTSKYSVQITFIEGVSPTKG